MIKKILFGLAALVLVFLIVAAMQPDEFHVERSASIDAPPMALFEHANDHRKFLIWSPWAKLDPNVKNTFSGPPAGVGAACSWDGNSEVGAGTATIIESKPGELVRLRMDWKRPMEGIAIVDFAFQSQGDKTLVTWSMDGSNNFIGKAMSVFMDCDAMIGPQLEQGLANLGAVAKAEVAAK